MRNASPYEVEFEKSSIKIDKVTIDADRIVENGIHLCFYCGAELVFSVRERAIITIENKEKEYVKRFKCHATHDFCGSLSRFFRKYFFSA